MDLNCAGSGKRVPMLDPDCEAMRERPATEAYCWHCNKFVPVGPAFKSETDGWIAILKQHPR